LMEAGITKRGAVTSRVTGTVSSNVPVGVRAARLPEKVPGERPKALAVAVTAETPDAGAVPLAGLTLTAVEMTPGPASNNLLARSRKTASGCAVVVEVTNKR